MKLHNTIYLFAGKQLILIDRDVNAIMEGDAQTLEAILKEKIAVKPYKKYEKELVQTNYLCSS
jgi:hypothetical protein